MKGLEKAPATEAIFRFQLEEPSKLLSVSPSVQDLLGFTAESFRENQRLLLERLHPEDLDISEFLFSIQTPLQGCVHIRLRHADGRIRCVHGRYTKSLEPSPSAAWVEIALQDVRSLPQSAGHPVMSASFCAMMENTDDFIYFKNSHHVFTGASQTLVSLTHPTEHWRDLLGQTDYDLFPEKYADIYYRLEKMVFAGVAVAQEIQPYETIDGNMGWVDNRKYPIHHETGEIIGLFGVARDITEKLKAERELHREHETLQLILDYAPIGIWLQDGTGKLGFVNRAFCRATGISEQEFLSVDHYAKLIPENFRQQCLDSDDKALGSDGVCITHQRLPFVDGAVHDLRVIKAVKRDEAGDPLALVGLSLDITEELRQEAQLREERDTTRNILETVEAIIVAVAADGRITLINRKGCELLGYNECELIGRDWFATCLPPEMDHKAVREVFSKALVGDLGGSEYYENPVVTRSGDVRLIAWHNSSIRAADGTIIGGLAAGEDITERKQAELALQQSEERLRLALAAATQAWFDVELKTGKVAVSDDYPRMLGYDPGSFHSDVENWLRHIHPEDRTQVMELFEACKKDGGPHVMEYRRQAHSGEWIWIRSVGRIVQWDAAGTAERMIGIHTDITRLKEHERQLEHIAHYDQLTDLPNRVLLSDRLHQAMVQSSRRGQKLAVAYIDLDGFKTINDRFGHAVGDQLLMTVARTMKHSLREGDTLARLGGDEFVAVLIDLADIESSLPFLMRILAAASAPYNSSEQFMSVSASIGVTFYPQGEEVNADQLLRQADQAMYQAKLAGKNRYHIFDAEEDRTLRSRHESLEYIRRALDQNEFVLHYQPKVRMRSGEVIGVEALLRWNHPDLGLLCPGLFLPVVENHPLSVELGEWVLATALAQMESWRSGGLNLPVSVNISARHLQSSDFTDRLGMLLDAHPLVPPESLQIEVLETSALEDLGHVSHLLQVCQQMGVNAALDDFGTGYATLAYLKRLSVSQLKIDQSFVCGMLDDPDDLAILEGIIGLATAFRRQVIAEGVETVEHGILLLHLGCELAQGFGIARPMPADELYHWLQTWQPDPRWVALPKIRTSDISLLYALVEIRAWIAAIEAAARGEREMPALLDPAECRLGSWLAGVQSDDAALQDIVRLHRKLHQQAKVLSVHSRSRRAGQMQTHLDALLDIRDSLLERLQIRLDSM